jgi:hypothetical protein
LGRSYRRTRKQKPSYVDLQGYALSKYHLIEHRVLELGHPRKVYIYWTTLPFTLWLSIGLFYTGLRRKGIIKLSYRHIPSRITVLVIFSIRPWVLLAIGTCLLLWPTSYLDDTFLLFRLILFAQNDLVWPQFDTFRKGVLKWAFVTCILTVYFGCWLCALVAVLISSVVSFDLWEFVLLDLFEFGFWYRSAHNRYWLSSSFLIAALDVTLLCVLTNLWGIIPVYLRGFVFKGCKSWCLLVIKDCMQMFLLWNLASPQDLLFYLSELGPHLSDYLIFDGVFCISKTICSHLLTQNTILKYHFQITIQYSFWTTKHTDG